MAGIKDYRILEAERDRLKVVNEELVRALLAVISVADRETDEFDLARAALAKARGE